MKSAWVLRCYNGSGVKSPLESRGGVGARCQTCFLRGFQDEKERPRRSGNLTRGWSVVSGPADGVENGVGYWVNATF